MGSRPPVDFGSLIGTVARELERRDLPFMLIGGQAVLLHGRPRLTEDIDITLGADPSRLPELMGLCEGLGLIPLPADVESFVRDTFVLPVRQPESGARVDFVFSTTPYEREAIARAARVEVSGTHVPFASAEDLILHKLFAGRPRDWEDAVSVARRRRREIDWTYVERWANEFAAIPGRETLPDDVRRLRQEGG